MLAADIRNERTLGPAIVEELGVQVEHDVTAVAHDEAPVAAERAEVGELHTVVVAPGAAARPAGQVGRRRPSAPAPRQPDLPGLESWVLERDHIELYVGADALGHLADRRRQPAGLQSVIAVQSTGAVGSGEHVDQPLLGDRVADLHAGAGDVAGRRIHRQAGERGTADAVSAGATAQHDDVVAGMRAGRRLGIRATMHPQKTSGLVVNPVVEDGAGDRRQADLVAVIGDAVDHAIPDPARMQRTVGEVVDGEVGRPEAQHIGHGERSVCRAEHVADDAADTGVGAAERLHGRRVVVRLGLEGERRARDERHDAGVAHERRPDERRTDGLGRRTQPVEQRWAGLALVRGDGRPEGLVGAVLAPGLGERLQLDVGRVSAFPAEVACTASSSAASRARPRCTLSSARPSRDRSRSAMVSTTGRSGVPGWRSGSARPDVHSSMTGLATSLRSNRSMVSASVPAHLEAPSGGCRTHRHPEADGRHGRRRPPSCR